MWLAFDDPKFGEVIYFSENNTEDLGKFFEYGDEHRLLEKTIYFNNIYEEIPQVEVFITGVTNEGSEYLFSVKATNVEKNKFILLL